MHFLRELLQGGPHLKGRAAPMGLRRVCRDVCTWQDLHRRNIHIRRFNDVPMADTELIFPDKNIYLKTITLIQILVTIIGGITAAASMLYGVRWGGGVEREQRRSAPSALPLCGAYLVGDANELLSMRACASGALEAPQPRCGFACMRAGREVRHEPRHDGADLAADARWAGTLRLGFPTQSKMHGPCCDECMDSTSLSATKAHARQ